MRNTVTIIAIATAALSLGACGGGATVDNQTSAESTVPPLVKTTKTSVVETSTSSSVPTSESMPGGGVAAPAPRDQAAQEVSALPTAQPRSAKEKQFLDQLSKQGIKVDGVEDQMISVAGGVCISDKNNPIVGAVAGQLVEQKRSSKKPEEVADVLVKTSKEAYC